MMAGSEVAGDMHGVVVDELTDDLADEWPMNGLSEPERFLVLDMSAPKSLVSRENPAGSGSGAEMNDCGNVRRMSRS